MPPQQPQPTIDTPEPPSPTLILPVEKIEPEASAPASASPVDKETSVPELEPETSTEIPQPESTPPKATPEPEPQQPTLPPSPQNIPSPPSSSAKATADKTADRSNNTSFIQTLLIKARAKIQERKQKKLDKILELLETKPQITNQDVQKLLRTSRTSACRYLDILEKQNKVKQNGNTGKWVFYSKN